MQFFLVLAAVIACVAGAPGSSRILGGTPATMTDFPYVVSLSKEGTGHICGGFIYNVRWVVTAASCLEGQTLTSMVVIAGSSSLNQADASAQFIRIDSFTPHPDYQNTSKVNDIALVMLARPIVVSGTSAPIRYDEVDEFPDAKLNGTVVGWGATSNGGNSTVRLRQGQIANLTADCNKEYTSTEYNRNLMVCAGNDPTATAVSPCEFDLGTPLVQNISYSSKPNERVVVGIFAKNKGCLEPSKPSIYTRLSAYYSWLQQVAGQQAS